MAQWTGCLIGAGDNLPLSAVPSIVPYSFIHGPITPGMDRQDLYELWQADAGRGLQNKDRPAFVREHRDALAEHTDLDDPLPDDDAPIHDWRDWLESYKGTVTRQLNDDADGTDPHDDAEAEA